MLLCDSILLMLAKIVSYIFGRALRDGFFFGARCPAFVVRPARHGFSVVKGGPAVAPKRSYTTRHEFSGDMIVTVLTSMDARRGECLVINMKMVSVDAARMPGVSMLRIISVPISYVTLPPVSADSSGSGDSSRLDCSSFKEDIPHAKEDD